MVMKLLLRCVNERRQNLSKIFFRSWVVETTIEIRFVDTLWEEGNDSEKVTGIEVKLAGGGGGE